MATTAQVERLAAGAKGGTAGVKAYDDAKKETLATKREALSSIGDSTAGFTGGIGKGLRQRLTAALSSSPDQAVKMYGQLANADANVINTDKSGTSLYKQEVDQALPLITAEANRDLGQKIAMLHASTARSGGSKGSPLSDSELRNQLLGAAIAMRSQQAGQAQDNYESDLQRLAHIARGGVTGPAALGPNEIRNTAQAIGPVGMQGIMGPQGPVPLEGPGGTLGGLVTPLIGTEPTLENTPDQIAQNFENEITARAKARQQALDTLLNRLQGPGITSQARELGLAAGVDPARLYGLLGPEEEQSYVNAQTKLGLYKPPGVAEVANQILPAPVAAQKLGLDEHTYNGALQTTYFDWNGDPGLASAFKQWLNTPAGALEAGKSIADQRKAFEAAPDSSYSRKPVISDVIGDANHAVNLGVDYDTFVRSWANEEITKSHPRTVALALEMVRPLFAYNAAQTRTTAPTG